MVVAMSTAFRYASRTSFNYGARKFKRVREAYLKAVLIATTISVSYTHLREVYLYYKKNKYLTRSMIEFIKMAIPGIEKNSEKYL